MAITTDKRILVMGETEYKVTYERRSFLGIINWWKEIKTNALGHTINILNDDVLLEKICLNGKIIWKKNEKPK